MPETPSISHAASAAMLAMTSLATRTAPMAPLLPIERMLRPAPRHPLRPLHVRLGASVDPDHIASLGYKREPARFPLIGALNGRCCAFRAPASCRPDRSEERRVGKECRSRWS